MNLLVINQGSGSRVPRQFLSWWINQLSKDLVKALARSRSKKNVQKIKGKELVLVFLSQAEAKKLNKTYRGKNYVTDVLSFAPSDDECVGDLAISLDKVRLQAREHHLHVWEELGYVVIHGVLHLLGYDHETNDADAKVMFALQDRLFEELCHRYERGKQNELGNRINRSKATHTRPRRKIPRTSGVSLTSLKKKDA